MKVMEECECMPTTEKLRTWATDRWSRGTGIDESMPVTNNIHLLKDM